ncbi:MAG: creatininase family protein [Gemmatimonadota bacterium]|jgi:creatinine amidohydrolase/Fe(II)-dependent formamide hydrolase-like protein
MKEEANRNPPKGSEEPGSRSWFLERLPWPEVGRALARDPRLILPVGAMVQHGPHLPLGTNTIISEAVARAVSRELGILRAPAFHYGVRGPERESFAGTAGIQRKTLHRALNELLAEWEDHGFQEFILLSAHRHEAHVEALLMALTSSAATTVVNLFTIEVGDILEGSPFSEHGGELETSLMLHLAPDLVRMEHAADVIIDSKTLRKYARGRVATPPPGSRGILGVPSRATPEKGAAVFSRYIQALKEILGEGSSVD